MACAPSKDEQMPNGMVISEFLPAIEDDSQHVCRSARDKEDEPIERDAHHELAKDDNHQPAHPYVGENRKLPKPALERDLQDDPESSQPPHDSEQEKSL